MTMPLNEIAPERKVSKSPFLNLTNLHTGT
jgi:hypothetical protein